MGFKPTSHQAEHYELKLSSRQTSINTRPHDGVELVRHSLPCFNHRVFMTLFG